MRKLSSDSIVLSSVHGDASKAVVCEAQGLRAGCPQYFWETIDDGDVDVYSVE